MESYDIYAELDALLDTRLGSLMQQAPEKARTLITDLRYYQRSCDDFEALTGLPKAVTDAHYAKRDVETLAATLMTSMVLQLRKIARTLYQESFTNPAMNKIKVEVNYWPYQLSAQERDQIAAAIRAYIGVDVPVVMINHHPREITPERIRAQYSGMLLYNFNQWLVHHTDALKRTAFPRVTVMAPQLYVDKAPTDPTEITFENPSITPWSLARRGYAPYFTLVFIPVSQYCIIPPAILKDILAEEPEDSSAQDAEAQSSSSSEGA